MILYGHNEIMYSHTAIQLVANGLVVGAMFPPHPNLSQKCMLVGKRRQDPHTK
jgi:hypothetical protein